jgi:diguanylate cyclase
VAEGVETSGQLEVLRALDCDLAQGFLFSKPLPAAEIVSSFGLPISA